MDIAVETQTTQLQFDEDAQNYGGFDYVILRQLNQVNTFANNAFNDQYKLAFINSVKTLHQTTTYYWLFDPEYEGAYKALVKWKKEIFENANPDSDEFEFDKPALFVKPVLVGEKNGEPRYGLNLVIEERLVKFSRIEVEELFARLHLQLLMLVITKGQKEIEITDRWT